MSLQSTQQISKDDSAVDIVVFDDSRLRTCHSGEECNNVIGKEIPPELLKELDDSEEEAKKKKHHKKTAPADNEKDDKNIGMNHVNAQSDNVLGKEIPPELLKEFEDSDEEEPKKKKRSRSEAGKTSAANDNKYRNNDKLVEEKDMKKGDAENVVAKPETGIERALELAVRQRKSITKRIKMKEQKKRSISSKKARKRQSRRKENGRNIQQKKSASKENMPNAQKNPSFRKSAKRKKNI